MIVATAGHIDHGKTLLVKRLTGVDTDRLPEEKARGISIDLGFAYLPVPGGGLIGFVDVPGHERFIRNMLAGVCGIDFALLVVAADDGIMPQTVEHLHILDLLGVSRGAAVVTKIDRVDAARIGEVVNAVQALLATTRMAGMPVLPASAADGTGIDELRQLLARESATLTARRVAGQRFRLAVDRAFVVAGSGTVVTGTVFNGTVNSGDKLTISPAGLPVRVRGIQIRGEAAERAQAGQRCALNLAGTGLDSVHRGDWVLDDALHEPTQRIDARVTVLAAEAQPLRHWTPVHLHLATSDVTARVAMRRGESVAPGASAVVQLLLDRPIGTLNADRLILRNQSATRTVGGGIVLDPFAPARRTGAARRTRLEALGAPSPAAALAALADASPGGVDLQRFARAFNLSADHAAEVCATADVIAIDREGTVGVPRAALAALREKIVPAVAAFHRATPQALGKEIESLRAELAPQLPTDGFAAVLRNLVDERRLEITGSVARVPGHNPTANAEDERLWQMIRPALDGAAFAAPPLRDLAAALKLKDAVVRDFLHRKAKGGDVFKVGAERFYLRATLATLAAIAQATAQAQPDGQFTAAGFRDATGVGRGLAIEILECLDSLGITQRVGDVRKLRRDFVPILGAAAPVRPASGRAAAPRKAAPPARRPAGHRRY